MNIQAIIASVVASIMAAVGSFIPAGSSLPALPNVPGIQQPGNPGQSTISGERALQIATNHAGVPRNQIRVDDLELDSDDGRLSWEIEFHHGNWEYEYDIDAYTGAIIKSERDWDD
jgi:uncharacterized membrane protein YkoI